ncbi:SEC-C domain-containing protein [Adhaeribacter swui]|uniref:SEC-C domain-containing protein n=1 Tax=Adhaeribacter swui TaxID=2086471 RepID=A0A7G7GB80_9BACT|nr:SEC-C domain-containing protein [Adhaeribacter swui]QNF34414.1 SEC-C domain-containing protein [Adhaeribacter swui]
MEGYLLFLAQTDEVIVKYPKLKIIESEGQSIIKGEIDIVDSYGKYWTSYEIEIRYSPKFPNRFPILHETGGKIPKIGDWHVYEDSKACCLKIPPEEIIRCKNGISVLEFIEEEVIPYFFNQTHRMEVGYYVNGEYSHGAKGIYEYYSKILGTSGNIKLTIKMLRFIALKSEPKRTSLCFCGSSNKYRKCHREAYRNIAKINSVDLIYHVNYLESKKHLL